MAVTKLFSSFKRSSVHMGDYGSIVHCMKNIPSEGQMQVTFIWTWYSFFSGQMSLLESTILLGCCTRGPKSSSFWKKKRGPSVCPGRSTVGACNHTGFTAWRSGLFNLKWLPFCNLTHCLNFLSGFHFQASFIIVFFSELVVQFYVDTVKRMAHSHFVSGSPLRTLCLLIAGQPADVFNVENNVNSDYGTSHQPMEVLAQLMRFSVLSCLIILKKVPII